MMLVQLNHGEKLLLEKGAMLFEFKAMSFEDKPVFAFLLMGKEPLASLTKDLKTKSEIYYTDYGTVVHSGTGIPDERDQQAAKDRALDLVKAGLI